LAACLGGGGGAGTNLAAAAIVGLNLPENVEVLQDDAALAGSLAAVNMAAYNSAGTDYTKAKGDVWIKSGGWQNPLDMADMLICIMNGSMESTVINSTYLALVDMSQCEKEGTAAQAGKVTRFAQAFITNARASNTANMTGKAWFINAEDENNDGDTTDPDETKQYEGTTTIIESATAANPFGVFNFDWNQYNVEAGDYSRGSLTFSEKNASEVNIQFVNEEKCNGNASCGGSVYNFDQWASGELNKDGSGGKLQVKEVDGGTTNTYLLHFNSTHVNLKTNSANAVCYSLDESAMSTYTSNYNIYDSTTGALKDITAGLPLYVNSGHTIRGYAGSYRNSSGVEKHWIWTEDGSKPTTVYREDNVAVSYSVAWSTGLSPSSLNGKPTISGLSFDQPVRFTADITGIKLPNGNSAADQTHDLNYEGPGQLWGINWTNGGSGPFSPAYNIADGTELTATDSTKWRVKAMNSWKTLNTAAGQCSTLGGNTPSVSFSSPTLRAVTTSWANKPTVTSKAKIIHGVKQY